MGYFTYLLNGIYWGYNPLILTVDPNFQKDIPAYQKPFHKNMSPAVFVFHQKPVGYGWMQMQTPTRLQVYPPYIQL